MSMTISTAEGVTVFTIHSNKKSKWPLFCQILGTMCYSPVYSVSQRLNQRLGCALTALATIQIMVGVIHLGFGTLTAAIYVINNFASIFLGLGGVITAVGIMCILAEKFPSPCLVVLTVVMNVVSAALAITCIVLYTIDMVQIQNSHWCELPERRRNLYSWTSESPAEKAEWDEIIERKLEEYKVCQDNWLSLKNICTGLDIMMIVLSVLHLCITISWCVLTMKGLRNKKAYGQDVEDAELLNPLMVQEIPNLVC